MRKHIIQSVKKLRPVSNETLESTHSLAYELKNRIEAVRIIKALNASEKGKRLKARYPLRHQTRIALRKFVRASEKNHIPKNIAALKEAHKKKLAAMSRSSSPRLP